MKHRGQIVHEEVYNKLKEELAQVGICVLLISWLTKQRALRDGTMLPVRMLINDIESNNLELVSKYYSELEKIADGDLEDELPGLANMMAYLRGLADEEDESAG